MLRLKKLKSKEVMVIKTLRSINTEAEQNKELGQMIRDSRKEYKQGQGMTTLEFIRSLRKNFN